MPPPSRWEIEGTSNRRVLPSWFNCFSFFLSLFSILILLLRFFFSSPIQYLVSCFISGGQYGLRFAPVEFGCILISRRKTSLGVLCLVKVRLQFGWQHLPPTAELQFGSSLFLSSLSSYTFSILFPCSPLVSYFFCLSPQPEPQPKGKIISRSRSGALWGNVRWVGVRWGEVTWGQGGKNGRSWGDQTYLVFRIL